MPTSSVGRASRAAGVTLIEMLVVVTLISMLAGISYPSVNSGLDTLRLNAASQSVVAFLNSGLNRAERRQQAMEVTFARGENALYLRAAEPGFTRKLELPEGIAIDRVLPEPAVSFLLYPGGTVPRIGVVLVNRRNVARLVQVDPMTGVPSVSVPVAPPQ